MMDLEQASRQAGIDIPALFSSAKAKADLSAAMRCIDDLPDDMAMEVLREFVRRHRRGASAQRSANIWIRQRSSALRQLVRRWPVPIYHLNTDLRRAAIAKEWADRCAGTLHQMTEFGRIQVDSKALLEAVKYHADQWGFCPVLPSFDHYEQKLAEGSLPDAFFDMVAGALARLVDDKWWVRQLERSWRRHTEHAAIIMGKVKAGTSPYISHKAMQEYKQRKQANAAWLNSVYAVNEQEQLQILLADAVGSSIANPAVRRAELMVRMRGFEGLAESQGYVGEFYTWTAPSCFHSWKKAKKGPAYANKKYQGSDPRATQKYLCQQWAKCRSKLHREEIELFGFRVVEPHHDGTPHWHLLLFFKPEQLRQARSIMRRYALEHHKEELAPPKGKKGPRHNGYRARFDFKTIDPDKGSATGYIAKYIAKNIDGAYVDYDHEAESGGQQGAEGVSAWASMWGIRQFQQIGGPSVTVWRELRRLKEAVANDELFERIRHCADASNWQNFVEFMGGTNCRRADRPLQLLKKLEAEATCYGEDVKRIVGVFSASHFETTRIEGWAISKYGLSDTPPSAAGNEGNLSGFSRLSDVSRVGSLSGGSRAPWSSDNNCTEGSKPAGKDRKPTQVEEHLRRVFGLTDTDIASLRAGAVFDDGEQQIKLRHDPELGLQLLVSQSPKPDTWADERSNKEYEAELAAKAREAHSHKRRQLRREAYQLMDAEGDLQSNIDAWWQSQRVEYQQLALDELADVIDRMQTEQKMVEAYEAGLVFDPEPKEPQEPADPVETAWTMFADTDVTSARAQLADAMAEKFGY